MIDKRTWIIEENTYHCCICHREHPLKTVCHSLTFIPTDILCKKCDIKTADIKYKYCPHCRKRLP